MYKGGLFPLPSVSTEKTGVSPPGREGKRYNKTADLAAVNVVFTF
jgi:hypothetical protein